MKGWVPGSKTRSDIRVGEIGLDSQPPFLTRRNVLKEKSPLRRSKYIDRRDAELPQHPVGRDYPPAVLAPKSPCEYSCLFVH